MTDSNSPKVVEDLAEQYPDLYAIWSEYNASFETEYTANDDGQANTHDSQNVQVTNTRGETTTVTWHKQWQDAYANQNHLRPDLYLDIYRVVHVPAEDGGETEPPVDPTDPDGTGDGNTGGGTGEEETPSTGNEGPGNTGDETTGGDTGSSTDGDETGGETAESSTRLEIQRVQGTPVWTQDGTDPNKWDNHPLRGGEVRRPGL